MTDEDLTRIAGELGNNEAFRKALKLQRLAPTGSNLADVKNISDKTKNVAMVTGQDLFAFAKNLGMHYEDIEDMPFDMVEIDNDKYVLYLEGHHDLAELVRELYLTIEDKKNRADYHVVMGMLFGYPNYEIEKFLTEKRLIKPFDQALSKAISQTSK